MGILSAILVLLGMGVSFLAIVMEFYENRQEGRFKIGMVFAIGLIVMGLGAALGKVHSEKLKRKEEYLNLKREFEPTDNREKRLRRYKVLKKEFGEQDEETDR